MPTSTTIEPYRVQSAILCADVHGYSRLMSQDEVGTYHRVTSAISLIRALIGDYGGRVVQTSGDGVLALFKSSGQALRFAIEIQREFRNDAVWNAEERQVAFRVGINFGEVLGGDSNIQGHSVNIAARLQAMAQPGGICVSEAVQRSAGDIVGISLRSLGVQQLKNITDPVEVFAIEINGQRSIESPQLPSMDQPLVPQTEASVAVLPLENLSSDPGDGHLCDGITGDIITNLSRFRDLLVIARHSAFLFKNQDLANEKIGQMLGVRYLLTGGLQRAGSKIRLRVELSDAISGQVVWSDRYDGDLGDIFAFQDEVTDLIAARLAIQISAAEQRRLATSPPKLLAYGLNLRGQELSLKYKREANLHARRLFEQAVELDPNYGRSYAGLSRTFNLDSFYAWVDSPDLALSKSVELARAATVHDSLDARGYAELGYAYLYSKRHDEALAAYERATELNPNDADILSDMADALVHSNEPERAVELLKRAMRLNPCYPDDYIWHLGGAYFCLEDYQETINTVQKMQDQSEAHRLLAASHALLGNMKEARHHAEEVMRVHPNFSIAHWSSVPPLKDNAQQLKTFIEGLRKAGLK